MTKCCPGLSFSSSDCTHSTQPSRILPAIAILRLIWFTATALCFLRCVCFSFLGCLDVHANLVLWQLGNENAPALSASFGFFYNISSSFSNLLERTELFNVSHDIREQLVSAFGDLVSIVANVSMYFHKAILGLDGASVSVDIYRTFPHQIHTFRDRCDSVSTALWKHQLLKENVAGGKGMYSINLHEATHH